MNNWCMKHQREILEEVGWCIPHLVKIEIINIIKRNTIELWVITTIVKVFTTIAQQDNTPEPDEADKKVIKYPPSTIKQIIYSNTNSINNNN